VTPIPPQPTALPTVAPFTDLVVVSAVMVPASPTSGQPFTLGVTLMNQGTQDAGGFAVATSFLPGEVYSAVNVPNLPAGQQTVVNLSGTVTGSGTYTIAIVIDLNNQVDEGPNGEANNKPTFTYTVNP
jgi:subtilase family serine protease